MFRLLRKLKHHFGFDEVSFNWEYALLPDQTLLFQPYVRIYLCTQDYGWQAFDFLVDTGADFSMVPFFVTEICGIDVSSLKKSDATGISGTRISTWETSLSIKIGSWLMKVPVAITNDNTTPFILGRKGTLDNKFSWIFDNKKEKIIFRK